MTNSAAIDNSDTPEPMRLAPHTSRLLAAFVDYLLLSILFPLLAYKFENELLRFLMTLLIGGAYYSIGNSEIMRGQTLGKKVFGLRVIALNNASTINFNKSVLRFILSFGLIISLAELPSVIYREQGLISSAYLIEAHLGLALLYMMISLFLFLLQETRSGLHDLLCKTIVVRVSKNCSAQALLELLEKVKPRPTRKLAAFALGTVLAAFLFLGGFPSDQEINAIKGGKYYLEQELPIRIAYAAKEQEVLAIYISVLKHNLSSKSKDNQQFSDLIVKKLKIKNLLNSEKIKFYYLWDKDKEQKEPEMVEVTLNENS